VAPEGSHNGLGGIVDQLWCRERAERPGERAPKGGAHVRTVRAAPGQLEYFVALAMQQHSQQSALRKGRG